MRKLLNFAQGRFWVRRNYIRRRYEFTCRGCDKMFAMNTSQRVFLHGLMIHYTNHPQEDMADVETVRVMMQLTR